MRRLTSGSASLASGLTGSYGPAGPERVLVELQPLVDHAAEYHRAQPAVADRQGANPLGAGDSGRRPRRGGWTVGRGLSVPQTSTCSAGGGASPTNWIAAACGAGGWLATSKRRRPCATAIVDSASSSATAGSSLRPTANDFGSAQRPRVVHPDAGRTGTMFICGRSLHNPHSRVNWTKRAPHSRMAAGRARTFAVSWMMTWSGWGSRSEC